MTFPIWKNIFWKIFDFFSAEFDLERNFGRKKFHLFKQLGHDVDDSHFSLMKTEERKKNHDEIIGKNFGKLGWEFLN